MTNQRSNKASGENTEETHQSDEQTQTSSHPKPSSPHAFPAVLTNQEFSDYIKTQRQKQKDARQQLVIHKHPIKTLRNFFLQSCTYVANGIRYISTHRFLLTIFLIAILIHIIGTRVPGPQEKSFDWFEEELLWAGWWIGLGILSSVGLGTGMHSGILFLFPHIGEVCLAAAECQSLNFEQHGENRLICPEDGITEEITFWKLFSKVFWVCFLWGAGTAIGEIPPYAVAFAAASAGEDPDEELEVQAAPHKWDLVNRSKVWMFDLLHKHGFWAILAFASWPNMAFDLCGIACGHFLLPFWTFFGATFIGKALIKVNFQASFFVTLFSEHLVKKVVHFFSSYSHLGLDDFVEDWLQESKKKFHKGGSGHTSGGSVVGRAWNWFMIIFIGAFILSIINSFAQNKQKETDERNIKKMMELRAKAR